MAVTEHTVEVRYGSSLSKTSPNCFYFSGMPTPYVSRSQEMVYVGGKWCQLTTISLDGQIIGSEPVAGENLNTISIKNDREKILSGFSQSFNKLGIFENNFNEIIFIEWPEILKNYNLKNVLELYFEYDKNYKNRFLTFSSSSNISYLNEFK